MSKLLNNITSQLKENSVEENLFVKNIIVNKNKIDDTDSIYIPTEKWVMQLGKRLELNF
jgi:hypothetical protein